MMNFEDRERDFLELVTDKNIDPINLKMISVLEEIGADNSLEAIDYLRTMISEGKLSK